MSNKEISTQIEETKVQPRKQQIKPKEDDIMSVEDKDVQSPKNGQTTNAKTLGIFKLDDVDTPSVSTDQAACFDIKIFLKENDDVNVFTPANAKHKRKVLSDSKGQYIDMHPNERIQVPTGLIFDIPLGYSLKVHPRSGTSLKQGINLVNQEAVIDSDYVDELFILLHNTSTITVRLYSKERYAQGELQEVIPVQFKEVKSKPTQKTNRNGGLGHTGV